MTKIAHVIIILKLSRKGESVIISRKSIHFFFVIVLEIVDVLASSVPADVLFGLRFGTESVDPHSIVIKRIGLGQIKNIELHLLASFGVGDSEEVPLGVAIGVYVVLEDQIVFSIGDLDGGEEVAGLEATFKDESFVVGTF